MKDQLEKSNLDGTTTDAISAVELILEIESKLDFITTSTNELDISERMLRKQRFHFPDDWIPYSNINGTLSDLNQILNRRQTKMKSMHANLQKKFL